MWLIKLWMPLEFFLLWATSRRAHGRPRWRCASIRRACGNCCRDDEREREDEGNEYVVDEIEEHLHHLDDRIILYVVSHGRMHERERKREGEEGGSEYTGKAF